MGVEEGHGRAFCAFDAGKDIIRVVLHNAGKLHVSLCIRLDRLRPVQHAVVVFDGGVFLSGGAGHRQRARFAVPYDGRLLHGDRQRVFREDGQRQHGERQSQRQQDTQMFLSVFHPFYSLKRSCE